MIIERKSTNGRWGIKIVCPEESRIDKKLVRGGLANHGKKDGFNVFSFVPGDGNTWCYLGGDIEIVKGAEIICRIDLQSSSYTTLVSGSRDMVLREFGYKRRNSRTFWVNPESGDNEDVPLEMLLKIEAAPAPAKEEFLEIKNCTPHAIEIRVANGDLTEITTFEPCGIIPRVETLETPASAIGAFPVVTQEAGSVIGLPELVDGVYLLVSGMVFNASDRKDLIAPDTGKTAIRNDKGQIVAVTRFLRK